MAASETAPAPAAGQNKETARDSYIAGGFLTYGVLQRGRRRTLVGQTALQGLDQTGHAVGDGPALLLGEVFVGVFLGGGQFI